MNTDNTEALISELKECASLLTKLAEDESLVTEKTASASFSPASSGRADYMAGVMEGLGLDEQ